MHDWHAMYPLSALAGDFRLRPFALPRSSTQKALMSRLIRLRSGAISYQATGACMIRISDFKILIRQFTAGHEILCPLAVSRMSKTGQQDLLQAD
eukprot:6194650-Pleurochrysis_carterae.AAC.5